MTDKQPLERGAWVGWNADRLGYTCTVYDHESNEIEVYEAGNSPLDSGAYIPLDSKERRVPLPTLRKYARQTAQDMARDWGIPLVMINEEEIETSD